MIQIKFKTLEMSEIAIEAVVNRVEPLVQFGECRPHPRGLDSIW